MAVTRMSYILIEKDKCEDQQSIEDVCREILAEVCNEYNENFLGALYHDRLIHITYRINQKDKSDKCYLELISKDRENANIAILEQIDSYLKSTPKQKYFSIINDYDGVSEYYCRRLYPKLAEFERLLREFILVILTKAYGVNWFSETSTEEIAKPVKERAQGNKNIIEHMDYNNMEKFLFEPHKPDIDVMFNNDLSVENIQKMNIDELKAAIEKNRPKSLWEVEFQKYGAAEVWQNDFKEIHATRNKVAHNKSISNAEFKRVNRVMMRLIRDLKTTIKDLQEQEFNDITVINVMGNLAQSIQPIYNPEEFRETMLSMTKIVSEALSNLRVSFPKPAINISIALADNVYSIQQAVQAFYRGAEETTKELRKISAALAPSYNGMQECIKALQDKLTTYPYYGHVIERKSDDGQDDTLQNN